MLQSDLEALHEQWKRDNRRLLGLFLAISAVFALAALLGVDLVSESSNHSSPSKALAVSASVVAVGLLLIPFVVRREAEQRKRLERAQLCRSSIELSSTWGDHLATIHIENNTAPWKGFVQCPDHDKELNDLRGKTFEADIFVDVPSGEPLAVRVQERTFLLKKVTKSR